MRSKTALILIAGAAALLGLAGLGYGAWQAGRCDSSARIGPGGDELCLPEVATVAFPAGAFAAPSGVSLSTSADEDVAALFRKTTVMFLTAGRLDYELRIAAEAAPATPAQVTMPVPEELLRVTLTGHGLEAFAAIDRGGMTMFEALESRFDPATRTISFPLPGEAFASGEAIVTLAPTLSGGDCH